MTCKNCRGWKRTGRPCTAAAVGECDCPKCQGLCTCGDERPFRRGHHVYDRSNAKRDHGIVVASEVGRVRVKWFYATGRVAVSDYFGKGIDNLGRLRP